MRDRLQQRLSCVRRRLREQRRRLVVRRIVCSVLRSRTRHSYVQRHELRIHVRHGISRVRRSLPERRRRWVVRKFVHPVPRATIERVRELHRRNVRVRVQRDVPPLRGRMCIDHCGRLVRGFVHAVRATGECDGHL